MGSAQDPRKGRAFLPARSRLENGVSKGSQKDYDRFWWIFAAIKQAARYPHLSGTWIGSNHTLQYSEDNTPFHESTKLCSAIFLHLDEKDFGGKYGDRMNYMRTKDGSYINLLCFIPLYAEEIDFKLDNGSDELFMRMFGSTVTDMSQLVLDPQRKITALPKQHKFAESYKKG